MKIFTLILLLTTSATICYGQTTWNVEAGGVPDTAVLPYFNPQFLTINEGDIVVWTNVEGFHSINGSQATFPNNPASFSHPAESAPYTFEFTFTVPGVYDYECSVGSHNETQFGTITVIPADLIGEQTFHDGVSIAPMPIIESSQIVLPEAWSNSVIQLFNCSGDLVLEEIIVGHQFTFHKGNLRSGVYVMKITNAQSVSTSKVMIRD